MDYLILDTNIFISLCLRRTESVTAPCYESIKKLLENNEIKLVVPDIVRREFQINITVQFENTKKYLKEVLNRLDLVLLPFDISNSSHPWKEIDNEKKLIANNLKGILDKLKGFNINDHAKPIWDIMNHRNSEIVHITDNLVIKTYRRILERKAPAHENKNEADCLIIESAIDFFEQIERPGNRYFISFNTEDFSEPNSKEQLHPDLAPIFEKLKIHYSPYLTKVLKEKFGQKIDDEDIEFEDKIAKQVFSSYSQRYFDSSFGPGFQRNIVPSSIGEGAIIVNSALERPIFTDQSPSWADYPGESM